MRDDSFSQRRGLVPVDIPIIPRDEVSPGLRDFIVTAAQRATVRVGVLRDLLCTGLLESPNDDNWSDGNIEREVKGLLKGADWFHVFDFCEEVANWLQNNRSGEESREFSRELNQAFRQKGIGWQLIDRKIETRGEEAFEFAVRSAISITTMMSKTVAANELHEALADLSKRPNPDITGAIQHAMAALECVARTVSGDEKATLGELLKKNPDLFPKPLNTALLQIWGFSSEHGRHLRENGAPAYEEAELVVSLSGTLTTYLLKKFKTNAIPRTPPKPTSKSQCDSNFHYQIG